MTRPPPAGVPELLPLLLVLLPLLPLHLWAVESRGAARKRKEGCSPRRTGPHGEADF